MCKDAHSVAFLIVLWECTFSRRKRRNRCVEKRGDAGKDRCQRCSGACHWSTAVFCVRMLRNVELYASLQKDLDFAFFLNLKKTVK